MNPELTYFIVQDNYNPISGPLDTLGGAIAFATFKLLEREEADALIVVGLEQRTWSDEAPCHFLFKIQPLSEWHGMAA